MIASFSIFMASTDAIQTRARPRGAQQPEIGRRAGEQAGSGTSGESSAPGPADPGREAA